MKKLLLKSMALLLVAVMAISAFASCEETEKQDNDAQSEKEEVNDSEKTSDDNKIGTEGLAYKLLDNGTYEVSVGNAKEATEIVIPSKYNGKPVTRIGYRAFSDCTRLTSIDIPDSVTSIGDDAFKNCTGLTSIDIPDSVTSIGGSSFSGTAYYNNESNLENGVLYIGKYLIKARYDISGDYSVKEGTKIIAPTAFSGCGRLTSIDIPDSVTNIGDHAFKKCKGLTSIDIPDSVTSIGDDAFQHCTGLTSVDIPDSVTSIGDYAFSGCTGLTSIDIPDSVKSIGGAAFIATAYYDNESNWENDVLYIGKYLIKAKSNISGDYSVKEGTKIIASYAFSGCGRLTSIDIPDSVKSIGNYAFQHCTGLTSIKFRGTEAEWNAIEKGEDWNLRVPESFQIIYNYTGE